LSKPTSVLAAAALPAPSQLAPPPRCGPSTPSATSEIDQLESDALRLGEARQKHARVTAMLGEAVAKFLSKE
jgi:hypothetical protein